MKKEASFTAAVGEVIDLLDLWITAQAGWSEYDSYGTEKKVYLCDGGSVPFYLYVDDDTAGYSEVKLYEKWDKGAHTGSGNSTATQYIVKNAATWRVVGDVDHLIIYCADTVDYARGMYAGYTTPIISGDTKSIFIIASNSSSGTHGFITVTNYSYGFFLFKYGGGVSQGGFVYHPGLDNDQAIAINGEGIVLFPPYVGENSQNKRARGTQKSIYGDGSNLVTGFSVGDTIYLDEMPFVARRVYDGYCWVKNG